MRLALFDLDNTLLLGDSDHAWPEYLITIGALDEESFRQRNDGFFSQYQAGTLDIYEFLDFQLSPLARYPKAQLVAWRDTFLTEIIDPMIVDEAHRLVETHRRAGDLLVIITATNRFITAPIAERFGIDNLIATEIEEIDGQYTGRLTGIPCFQAGKVKRLADWLENRNTSLETFETSYFYSDSINDLPLLEAVTSPVAVNADAKLTALATERNWPIIRFGQS